MANLKDRVVHWKKKIQKTEDDDVILDTVRKLAKVPMTLTLLEETGVAKVIRNLKTKNGKIGKKVSDLLKHWTNIIANSSKVSEVREEYISSKNNLNHFLPDNTQRKFLKLHNGSNSHEKPNDQKRNPSNNPYKLNQISNTSEKTSLLDSNKNYNESKYIKALSTHNDKTTKYIDYDINTDIQLGYNPDHPELYPGKINSVFEPIVSCEKYDPNAIENNGYDSFKKECKRKAEEIDSIEMMAGKFTVKKIKRSNSQIGDNAFLSSQKLFNGHSKDKIKVEKKDKQIEEEFKKQLKEELKQQIKVEKKDKQMGELKKQKKVEKKDKQIEELKKPIKEVVKKQNSLSVNGFSSHKSNVKHESSSLKHLNTSVQKTKSSTSKVKKETFSESESLKHHDKKIKDKKHSKRPEDKIKNREAFTSSEVSFEDCLGFNDIVAVKKKKPNKNSSNSPNKIVKKSSTKDSNNLSESNISKKHKNSEKKNLIVNEMPKDLQKMPEKSIQLQSVDIMSTLPEIQPNYRPLPQRDFDNTSRRRVMSNEEALMYISTRRERTAVYSGRKSSHLTEVPTLFESCLKVLDDNKDDIGYMGGVPYFLLKPVLERFNPIQLYRLENMNAYLLEDTGELWEKHCKRDFRTHTPEENETWREMYWRVYDEQERRLRNITANISASMMKSNPVRQVKLAYVDTVAKPPRDVARKQAKNGTGVIQKLNNINDTVKPSTSKIASSPVASSSRSQASSIPKKPKLAPLMAKTLKSMKLAYRRK